MAHELLELNKIGIVRKKLGLTQAELASRAGVSQSMVAKIEAGSIDPSYSNARKLISALTAFSKSKELKAHEIMNRKIISVSPEDRIEKAVSIMNRNGISQLPVIKDDRLVGHISDYMLLEHVIKKNKGIISEAMLEAPPVVSGETGLRVIIELLKYYPFVLVSEKGRLRGIITKADILGKI